MEHIDGNACGIRSRAERDSHRQGRDLAVVDRFLDDAASRANRHAIYYLIRPHLTDADDEFVLELAIASSSDYILTHNGRDFASAEKFGVNGITPAEFLRII